MVMHAAQLRDGIILTEWNLDYIHFESPPEHMYVCVCAS